MADGELFWNRPTVEPTKRYSEMIEGVGVGDAAKGGHEPEDFASDMFVVHPVQGVLHDARHGTVVFWG